jgi:hypothetical protein
MPSVCHGLKLKKTKNCSVTVKQKNIKVFGFDSPGIEMSIRAEGEEPISLELMMTDTNLTANPNPDGTLHYMFFTSDMPTLFKVGDRVHSLTAKFKMADSKYQPGLMLESLLLKPGVVVSIDKNREPICYTQTPKAVRFFDDAIVIKHEGVEPTALDTVYASGPGFAACSKENVVE